MDKKAYIKHHVHQLYWEDNLNCSSTTLKILGDIFNIELTSKTLNSVINFHGSSENSVQCGLLKGSLEFIKIFGQKRNFLEKQITKLCNIFTEKFKKEFGSILCKELRPQGFSKNNLPHLCENITTKAILFSTEFIEKI